MQQSKVLSRIPEEEKLGSPQSMNRSYVSDAKAPGIDVAALYQWEERSCKSRV